MSLGMAVHGFGLIVIGSEVLDGRVADKHFAATREALARRHHALRYALVLPDDTAIIEAQLRWAFARPEPFFCCGGIGATPDDLTRQCAASVLGLPLELHPEGVELLKVRFGDRATPARLRMVEFPQGATLIPNPVNQVPGFTVRHGHFVPGFPEMAAPMTEWVLDSLYRRGDERTAWTFRLPGAREADLVDLMERFIAAHPDLAFSSLPRFTADGTEVDLGIRGTPAAVADGRRDLAEALDKAGVPYLIPGASCRTPADGTEAVPPWGSSGRSLEGRAPSRPSLRGFCKRLPG
jgi:molybdopterin-biosynthesis enzyme MoeA-like protein